MIRNDPSRVASLGWRAHFHNQLSPHEQDRTFPCRVLAVHRGQLTLSDGEVEQHLPLSSKVLQAEEITVGDWLLLSQSDGAFVRLLDRTSLIKRQSAGTDKSEQLIAANVDTLFIVTSCNEDFNLSRLERYLALAHASRVFPVIAITKQDLSDDPHRYVDQVRRLDSNLIVELVDAHDPETLHGLQCWCDPGQTVALVGSSGVGKSTLANRLGAERQKTGAIREDDAKGRHTTTHRSLLSLANGSLLLDSPGIRELGLIDVGASISTVFEEIDALSQQCRFSDCNHDREPGCAVRAALESGALDPRRFKSYTKLLAEQERNGATLAERRRKDKATKKFHKKVSAQKKATRMF